MSKTTIYYIGTSSTGYPVTRASAAGRVYTHAVFSINPDGIPYDISFCGSQELAFRATNLKDRHCESIQVKAVSPAEYKKAKKEAAEWL